MKMPDWHHNRGLKLTAIAMSGLFAVQVFGWLFPILQILLFSLPVESSFVEFSIAVFAGFFQLLGLVSLVVIPFLSLNYVLIAWFIKPLDKFDKLFRIAAFGIFAFDVYLILLFTNVIH